MLISDVLVIGSLIMSRGGRSTHILYFNKSTDICVKKNTCKVLIDVRIQSKTDSKMYLSKK